MLWETYPRGWNLIYYSVCPRVSCIYTQTIHKFICIYGWIYIYFECRYWTRWVGGVSCLQSYVSWMIQQMWTVSRMNISHIYDILYCIISVYLVVSIFTMRMLKKSSDVVWYLQEENKLLINAIVLHEVLGCFIFWWYFFLFVNTGNLIIYTKKNY